MALLDQSMRQFKRVQLTITTVGQAVLGDKDVHGKSKSGEIGGKNAVDGSKIEAPIQAWPVQSPPELENLGSPMP